MKKYLMIFLTFICLFILSGCNKKEKSKLPVKHVLNGDTFPNLNTNDWPESPYYQIPDFYNMKSNDQLIILSHYATWQQELSYSCGACSAITVCNYFGAWERTEDPEYDMAVNVGAKPGEGTDSDRVANYFQNVLKWETDFYSSRDTKKFVDYNEFKNWCIYQLELGHPIMVNWVISSGHWTVIIGFDEGPTLNTADDVIIFADSSDSCDHYRDGYNVFGATRFFSMWRERKASDGGDPRIQPYVVAYPKKSK